MMHGQKSSDFSKRFRSVLGLTQPPILWVSPD